MASRKRSVPAPAPALWPYSGRAAVMWSAVALPVLVGTIVILTRRHLMGSLRLNLALLGGVVVTALLPLWLRLIDTMVDNGGTVALPGGVKLGFANARAAVQQPKDELKVTANLGEVRGAPVGDSGGEIILDGLRPATVHEIAVVDLGEGDAWWRTRLLLLCVGAQRAGNPEAIVFVGTEAGIHQRFVGWAATREIARLLLRTSNKAIVEAYRTGAAMAMRSALGKPHPTIPRAVELPWNTTPHHGTSPPPLGYRAAPIGRWRRRGTSWFA
jgi:hypothetical protein